MKQADRFPDLKKLDIDGGDRDETDPSLAGPNKESWS